MLNETTVLLADVVREAAHPLAGGIDDYDPLMRLIGDAPLVLIGEASHGTHEFYRVSFISRKRNAPATTFRQACRNSSML